MQTLALDAFDASSCEETTSVQVRSKMRERTDAAAELVGQPKVSTTTTSCRQLTKMLLHTAVQQAMRTNVVTKVDRRHAWLGQL
jgi:hypothetical protein